MRKEKFEISSRAYKQHSDFCCKGEQENEAVDRSQDLFFKIGENNQRVWILMGNLALEKEKIDDAEQKKRELSYQCL